MRRTQYVEVFTHKFILCLGTYRLFYIVYWTLELLVQPQFFSVKKILHLEIAFGLIQTALFVYLIYKYFKQLKTQKHIKIPI